MMTCSTPRKGVQTEASGFFNTAGVAKAYSAITMDVTMDIGIRCRPHHFQIPLKTFVI